MNQNIIINKMYDDLRATRATLREAMSTLREAADLIRQEAPTGEYGNTLRALARRLEASGVLDE
jgi:hypothetical protein